MQSVTLEEHRVLASSPEGETATLSLPRLVELLTPSSPEAVFPDGVKCQIQRGALTVWVHQTPPRIHNLKWIATDSPRPYGRGTRYRNVRVALPYVIVFAVFVEDRNGRLQLSDGNECFFRNAPLCSQDDRLCYPALLNCSRFPPDQKNQPLSWICTQYLRGSELNRIADDGQRLRRGLKDLLACLLESGFNYSSEHHEFSSWFSESRGVDPRISTIERWEAATLESPLFAIEVPWLPVGKSVKQIVERIATNLSCERPRAASAQDVARLVFNHGETLNRRQRETT